MTTNNDTYRTTVAAAEVTKRISLATVEQNHQSTIDAAKSVVGYREGFSTGFATFQAAVNAANTVKLIALADAERAKQATVQVAADLIRSQGEKPT